MNVKKAIIRFYATYFRSGAVVNIQSTLPTKVFVSAKAIIAKDNRFLIVRQVRGDLGYWDLPGGKVEYGETPEQTVVREVEEETNMDITVEKLLGTWQFFSPTNKYQVVCLTYHCHAASHEIDLSKNPANEDIQEYAWVTKSDFLSGKYPFLDKSVRKIVEQL